MNVQSTLLNNLGGAEVGIIIGVVIAVIVRILWALLRVRRQTVQSTQEALRHSISDDLPDDVVPIFQPASEKAQREAGDLYNVLSKLLATIDGKPYLGEDRRREIFRKAKTAIMAAHEAGKSRHAKHTHEYGFVLYDEKWLKDNARKLWYTGERHEKQRRKRGVEAIIDAYALYVASIYLAARSFDPTAVWASVAAHEIEGLIGLSWK